MTKTPSFRIPQHWHGSDASSRRTTTTTTTTTGNSNGSYHHHQAHQKRRFHHEGITSGRTINHHSHTSILKPPLRPQQHENTIITTNPYSQYHHNKTFSNHGTPLPDTILGHILLNHLAEIRVLGEGEEEASSGRQAQHGTETAGNSNKGSIPTAASGDDSTPQPSTQKPLFTHITPQALNLLLSIIPQYIHHISSQAHNNATISRRSQVNIFDVLGVLRGDGYGVVKSGTEGGGASSMDNTCLETMEAWIREQQQDVTSSGSSSKSQLGAISPVLGPPNDDVYLQNAILKNYWGIESLMEKYDADTVERYIAGLRVNNASVGSSSSASVPGSDASSIELVSHSRGFGDLSSHQRDTTKEQSLATPLTATSSFHQSTGPLPLLQTSTTKSVLISHASKIYSQDLPFLPALPETFTYSQTPHQPKRKEFSESVLRKEAQEIESSLTDIYMAQRSGKSRHFEDQYDEEGMAAATTVSMSSLALDIVGASSVSTPGGALMEGGDLDSLDSTGAAALTPSSSRRVFSSVPGLTDVAGATGAGGTSKTKTSRSGGGSGRAGIISSRPIVNPYLPSSLKNTVRVHIADVASQTIPVSDSGIKLMPPLVRMHDPVEHMSRWKLPKKWNEYQNRCDTSMRNVQHILRFQNPQMR